MAESASSETAGVVLANEEEPSAIPYATATPCASHPCKDASEMIVLFALAPIVALISCGAGSGTTFSESLAQPLQSSGIIIRKLRALQVSAMPAASRR